MGDKERYQKFMQDKHKVNFTVNKAIFDDFKKKLKEDGITQQYMLETAINRYLADIDHYKK